METIDKLLDYVRMRAPSLEWVRTRPPHPREVDTFTGQVSASYPEAFAWSRCNALHAERLADVRVRLDINDVWTWSIHARIDAPSKDGKVEPLPLFTLSLTASSHNPLGEGFDAALLTLNGGVQTVLRSRDHLFGMDAAFKGCGVLTFKPDGGDLTGRRAVEPASGVRSLSRVTDLGWALEQTAAPASFRAHLVEWARYALGRQCVYGGVDFDPWGGCVEPSAPCARCGKPAAAVTLHHAAMPVCVTAPFCPDCDATAP